MWSADKVSPDFANTIQVNAGTLLNAFDVSNPVEFDDSAIICATSGDFSFTCQTQTDDFFADVNNVPDGTKEGMRITGHDCSLSVTALDITPEMLAMALGAADVSGGTVTPRRQFVNADFKTVYWAGNMIDPEKLFVIKLMNAIGGGISFTSTKNGKGGLSLELTAHPSIANIEIVPMEFYVLTKVATYTYTAVASPTGNPSEQGYYERSGTSPNYVYTLSTDTTVDSGKTYYTRQEEL